MSNPALTFRPLIAAGTVLGIGMGGFFDGIVFHQIFQLHNMMSARWPVDSLANAEVNMVWDGLFHALTWIVTAVGIGLLWRARRRLDVPWSGLTFVGSLFLGWGLFNFVEGILNHHILHLHHVVERRGESIYDLLFLLAGVLFMTGGALAIWKDSAALRRPLANP